MTGTKYCNTCKTYQPLDNFHKCAAHKDGLASNCKNCTKRWNSKWWKNNKIEASEKRATYYARNKEEINRKAREKWANDVGGIKTKVRERAQTEEYRQKRRERYAKWAEKNKDKIRERQKEYRERNLEKSHKWAKTYREQHKEQIAEYHKKYREKNREMLNKKALERLHNNPRHKMKEQTRNMIRNALRSKNHRKNSRTKEILGCNLEFFCDYLLSTWEKRYKQKWDGEPYHIDHIIPLATAKTEEEIIKLCHYKNLQMLTPNDNMEKSDRIDWA